MEEESIKPLMVVPKSDRQIKLYLGNPLMASE